MRLVTSGAGRGRGGFIKGCLMVGMCGFALVVFVAMMSAISGGGGKKNGAAASPAPSVELTYQPTQAQPVSPAPKSRPSSDLKKKYSRDEFTRLVTGRTRDDVIALIGKPKATQKSGDDLELWDYPGRTIDPITGKTDDNAQVDFEGDRVSGVTFIKL